MATNITDKRIIDLALSDLSQILQDISNALADALSALILIFLLFMILWLIKACIMNHIIGAKIK